jgi:VWFA-related protein
MHAIARRTRALPLALAACAVTLAAQQPTFRTTTDLVEVDVVAVDQDGQPVHGLTQADFTLFDRTKPQTIATFQEVTHEHEVDPAPLDAATTAPPPRRDVASNRTAESDRLVVIVVDDLHIYKGRTDTARQITRAIVRDLGSQASMGLLFTSGDHNIEVTEDRTALFTAIDAMSGRRGYPRPILAVDDMHGQGPEPTQGIKEFYDDMNAYKTLQDAARMLAGDDLRRKAFVLVSEGIGKDLSGIFGAMSPPGDVPQGGLAYAAGDITATIKPATIEYHAFAVVDMMDAMRRSNVTTYAIDPRGYVSGQDLAKECHPAVGFLDDPCLGGSLPDWNSWVRQAQHGLEMTAEASGGFAITNTNDFTKGLSRIIDDLDHYYLLGFYPDDPQGGGYRRLDVKVTRPGVTLRFRRGYVAGGPPPPPKNADPLVALSSGVLPRTDLALRLTAVPSLVTKPKVDTPVSLALEVTVPRYGLTSTTGSVGDALRYTVLAADLKSGKVVRQFSNTAQLTSQGALPMSTLFGADRGAADAIVFQFPVQLTLPPGRYQLRASATSDTLVKGGSVYLSIDVPDLTAQPIAMSGLLLGYSDTPHVLIATSTMSSFGVDSGPPFPPTLDREFFNVDTLRLYFEASTRTPTDPLHALVAIVDATGKVLMSYPPPADTGKVDLRVPLADLLPGRYVLRVTVSDRTHTLTREVGFAIK